MREAALYMELTDLQIRALYELTNPVDYVMSITPDMIEQRKKDAWEKYNNDAQFYNLVTTVVNQAMDLIEKYQ